MQWIITADLINDEPVCVGRGSGQVRLDEATLLPVQFKLYDDDGELYFAGRCAEEDFAPLDWAMPVYGCTEIRVRRGNAKWETL